MKKITLEEFMALPAGSVSGSTGINGELKFLSVTSPVALKFRRPRLTKAILKATEKIGGRFVKFEGIVPVAPEDVERFCREEVIFVAQVDPKLSVLVVVDRFRATDETRPLFRLLEDIDQFETEDRADFFAQLQEQFHSRREMLVWLSEPNPYTGDDAPLAYFRAGLFAWVLEVARNGAYADPRNL